MSAEARAAQVSDALDAAGLRRQSVGRLLRYGGDGIVTGRVFTIQCASARPGTGERYAGLLAALDAVSAGDVVVVASGPSDIAAVWGELLSTACVARGAAGCITDGLVRDIRAIRTLGFPVFHGGIGPLDSKGRGKVMAIDVPIACGGVRVAPGDLMFGDADGVICIPREIEEKAIAAALQKVEGEDRTREALARGEKLAQVFARYGIL